MKVSYRLRPSGLATPMAPLPLFEDRERDPSRPGPPATASDLAPIKARADVLVSGRAHPQGPDKARTIVEIGVARGADVLLFKRLVVGTGRLAPGARSVGAASPSGGHAPPREPVATGPLAPRSPSRAAFLPAGFSMEEAMPAPPFALPPGFDVRFFQSAPQDQWMDYLRGGEHLRLTGLHPELPVVTCRLPALHAFAKLRGPGADNKPVPLVGDTLWVDMDALVACVTYRGSVSVEGAELPDDLGAGSPWTTSAGLAPCADVEESVASPRKWASSPHTAQAPAPSPTVDPISLLDHSGFAVGKVVWSPEPGVTRCAVIVKVTLDLPESPGQATIAEVQESLRGDEHASDQEGPKEGAALTYPSDHAPLKPRADVLLRGTAHAPPGKNSALVSLSVGSLEARVVALGPRAWGQGGAPVSTGPFEPVALTHENALGGPGFAANPAGTGIVEGSPPPRIESPDRLIRTRADRPPPASPGPVSPAWAARRELAGTFQSSYRERRWPCFPADFDPAYFQAAPAHLQTAHLRGDEAFRIHGVHQGGAVIEGSLPGVRPLAFALREAEEPAEIPLALDTCLFDADAMRAALVFRGSFEMASDREALRVVILREDMARQRTRDAILDEVCLRSAQPDFKRERSKLRSDPPASYALTDVLRALTESKGKGAALVAAGVALFAASRGRPGAPAPPAPPTRAHIERRIRDGESLSRLDLSGADLRGIDLSKQDLRGALLAGARLSGARLSEANLTGAKLAGIDASDSVWDGADLTRADATGARLQRASFAGATLRQAKLAKADLSSARLDEAQAEGASFVDANLKEARADGARLVKADLSGAKLGGASLRKAILDDAKLYEVTAEGAVLDEATMTDARFEKAALTGASFRSVRGPGAVWESADLGKACFALSELTGAVFAGAALVGADLRGARLRTAVFRSADLTGARLDGADLMRATFEGACLRRAILRGASLHQAETWMAVLEGADLTGAIVTGSKLDGV